jgi:hypothetical protein
MLGFLEFSIFSTLTYILTFVRNFIEGNIRILGAMVAGAGFEADENKPEIKPGRSDVI